MIPCMHQWTNSVKYTWNDSWNNFWKTLQLLLMWLNVRIFTFFEKKNSWMPLWCFEGYFIYVSSVPHLCDEYTSSKALTWYSVMSWGHTMLLLFFLLSTTDISCFLICMVVLYIWWTIWWYSLVHSFSVSTHN